MAAGEARHEKETKEKEAAFGRILKNHFLLEKRKWSKENLPLSFRKKKVEQRKPEWGGHLLAFGTP